MSLKLKTFNLIKTFILTWSCDLLTSNYFQTICMSTKFKTVAAGDQRKMGRTGGKPYPLRHVILHYLATFL